MATGMISPVMDTEEARLQDQLATAAALRKQAISGGPDTGAGMHGRVYMVGGGPLGQIAQALGGAYMDSRAREGLGGIEQARNQEREQFMSSMPEATEVASQFGPTQDGGSLPDVTREKSPEQQAQEMRRWASSAPRGMESVQQFALQQAMTAPQQAAARRDQQEARRLEMSIRAEEAAKAAQERRDWEAEQRALRAQEKRDNLILAASLKGGGGGNDPKIAFIQTVDAEGNPVTQVVDKNQLKPGDTFNKPLTANQQKQVDLSKAPDKIDAIIKEAEANEKSFGWLPSAAAMLPNAVGNRVLSASLTPTQREARVKVMTEASKQIHAIYGAALSRGEEARANTWAISPTDDYDTVMAKLKAAKAYAQSASSKPTTSAPAGAVDFGSLK